MKKLLLLTIVCLASCIFLAGGAWGSGGGDVQACVDPGGGGDYTTLQAALTAAQANSANDQIKVVQGTYTGHFTYNSIEGYNIQLLGGYTAGCAGRVLDPANTTLDGSGTGGVLNLYSHTTTGVAISDIIVDGFTIQNGGGAGTYYGAGVYAESRNDSTTGSMNAGYITISNNIITGNTADTTGGGVYASSQSEKGTSGKVVLSNNIITGNTATHNYAGGVYARSIAYEGTAGTLTLTNNIIAGNTSAMNGGGVYATSSSFAAASTITLTNNTITGNTTATSGGGLYASPCYGAVGGIINAYNNIIRGNTATSGGDDISLSCIATANGYNNNYHIINGTWNNSAGRIDADPLFVGSGNYHLLSTSPCIDTGLNTAPSIPSTDIDGDTRIINTTVDIGADEYVCPNQPVHIDGSSSYYDTIGEAYTAATTITTIKMHSYEFGEDLNFNLAKIITLQGGYDCNYVTNTGTYSTISGSLTIGGSAGTVKVENVKIK